MRALLAEDVRSITRAGETLLERGERAARKVPLALAIGAGLVGVLAIVVLARRSRAPRVWEPRPRSFLGDVLKSAALAAARVLAIRVAARVPVLLLGSGDDPSA